MQFSFIIGKSENIYRFWMEIFEISIKMKNMNTL